MAVNNSINKDFLLHLADNALVLGHRNSEWTGHGPILEQDIAISNIALDLIGQARNLYQYAAIKMNEEEPGSSHTEDSLAYLRDTREYRNFLMLELPKGDWAFTTLRQFFFSSWQKILFQQLNENPDLQLAAIAAKSLKETNYHVRWSGEWVIRLGDGTAESRRRLLTALNILWTYTGEFFDSSLLLNSPIHYSGFSELWHSQVNHVFQEATIGSEFDAMKTSTSWMQSGGINGLHTEHLGYLLAEMQFLQRAYPGATW
jgi:ring-1,2-phenylacetyl-CoA epoxidase subunit PaaC